MKKLMFSGMYCDIENIVKEGDHKIKGTVKTGIDGQEISRYEYFPSQQERDARYNILMNTAKDRGE